MTFAEFLQTLLDHLGLDAPASVDGSIGLYDDLGIDSFQAFEVIVVAELAAGLDVPPPELPILYTVEDAYSYYRNCLAAARGANG